MSTIADLPQTRFYVDLVSFSNVATQISDAKLEQFAQLAKGTVVRTVDLSGTSVTDEGLSWLAGLSICNLSCNATSISDIGLKHLTRIRLLHALSAIDCNITDEGLRAVGELTGLGWLDLQETQIGDEGLSFLGRLKKLNTLSLSGTKVTDRGMETLRSNHPGLTVLDISGTAVGDDGVEQLKSLRHLTALQVNGCRITKRGLESIGEMKGLKRLAICRIKLTEDSLQHLTGLKNLEHLDLSVNDVSGDVAVHLSQFPMLRTLYLNKTDIGDADLEHLKGLPSLSLLSLVNTKVTPAGIAELQAALPDCEIIWNGQPEETMSEPVMPSQTMSGSDSHTSNTAKSDKPQPQVPEANLINHAHWTFDEGDGTDAKDTGEGRGGFHGILKNMDPKKCWSDDVPPTKTPNRFSLKFDGKNDYIEVDPPPRIWVKGTFAAWIKTDNATFERGLIGTRNGDYRNRFNIAINDSGWREGAGDIRVWLIDSDGRTFRRYTRHKTDICDGRWHHLGVAWNGTTMDLRILVDGIRQDVVWIDEGSKGAPYNYQPFNFPLHIGHMNWEPEDIPRGGIDGLMDDVQLFGRDLSDPEIQELAARRDEVSAQHSRS